MAEQLDAFDLVHARVIRSGEGLDDKFAVIRPAQCNRIKRFAFGREADVLGAVGEIFLERMSSGMAPGRLAVRRRAGRRS
jgi:hypothetical protein